MITGAWRRRARGEGDAGGRRELSHEAGRARRIWRPWSTARSRRRGCASSVAPPARASDAPSTEMLLGSSPPMRELAQQIELLARSERTVALLVGEAGVGKGRVARAIHALSARGEHAVPRDRLLDASGRGARRRAVRRRARRGRAGARACSRRRTAARSSSTRSPSCRLRSSPSCCARSRRAGCAARAARARSPVDVRFIAATARDLATEVTEDASARTSTTGSA